MKFEIKLDLSKYDMQNFYKFFEQFNYLFRIFQNTAVTHIIMKGAYFISYQKGEGSIQHKFSY